MGITERFTRFRDNLRAVSTMGSEEIARGVVEDTESLKTLAIRLNQAQLREGVDSKGKPTGNYAERTKQLRQRRGLQVRHKDYRFTGSFFRHFYVKVVPLIGYIFKIDSSDKKRDKIVKGSEKTPAAGEDIFGLTPDNMEEFKKKFQPRFIKALRDAIKY